MARKALQMKKTQPYQFNFVQFRNFFLLFLFLGKYNAVLFVLISDYPFSAQCSVSYRNQSIVLLCKANESFLYETKNYAEMS